MIEGVSWREALIVVGVICALAGLFLRNLHSDVRGLGSALVVVGVMMFIAGPLGSILGWW